MHPVSASKRAAMCIQKLRLSVLSIYTAVLHLQDVDEVMRDAVGSAPL